jgi:hypothetical protein
MNENKKKAVLFGISAMRMKSETMKETRLSKQIEKERIKQTSQNCPTRQSIHSQYCCKENAGCHVNPLID